MGVCLFLWQTSRESVVSEKLPCCSLEPVVNDNFTLHFPPFPPLIIHPTPPGCAGGSAAPRGPAQLVCMHPLAPHLLQRVSRGPPWSGLAWALLRGLQVQEPPPLCLQSRASLQVDHSQQPPGVGGVAGQGREWGCGQVGHRTIA